MSTSVDVVIPVYNEEKDLPRCIATLHAFLEKNLSYDWRIVVADNGSTDSTLATAEALSKQYPKVGVIHLDQKGRGRALRRAMLESTADIVSYMDVDLSTDLAAFPPMIEAIAKEGNDIAMGSRLMKGARVTRSFKRELVSRCYNVLIKTMFYTRFKDAQCGFKAVSRRAVRDLVPLIQNQAWFFDSEMLILAEKNGYKVKEIPVRWIDDPDSRVNVLKTANEDIRGLLRLRFGGLREASRKIRSASSKTP
ncbi:MAG: glycosyltransferase family 2 protein [Chloroflexi bacterium]|nr:glycosyltransferase family 2 protein [Chloroflexota bacterium]